MQSVPTSHQLRAGRALLGLDQEQIAREAGISIATLRRAEAGAAPADTIGRVAETLVRAGVEFIERGVQLVTIPSAVATERDRRIDAILAQLDAIPTIDPNVTEASLYGEDGLPR